MHVQLLIKKEKIDLITTEERLISFLQNKKAALKLLFCFEHLFLLKE